MPAPTRPRITGWSRPLSGREPPGSHICTPVGSAGTSAAASIRDTTAAEHGPSTAGDALTGNGLAGSELAGATDTGTVGVTLDGGEVADDPVTGPAVGDGRGAAHPPASPTTKTAAPATRRRTSIPKGR